VHLGVQENPESQGGAPTFGLHAVSNAVDNPWAIHPCGQAFKASIYNVDTGGSALWSEKQTVSVSDGIFDVVLGQPGSAIDPADMDGELFLGVSVESDDEMTPRQPITSTAFAMKAAIADAVADGGVTTIMIVDDAITGAKVTNNSLTAADLAFDSVNASEIAAGPVGTSEIADGTVNAADLAEDFINTSGDTMAGYLTIDGCCHQSIAGPFDDIRDTDHGEGGKSMETSIKTCRYLLSYR
jgi:hypothetical protein